MRGDEGVDVEGFHERLVSRNWAFIEPHVQAAMRNSRILFAGCGLGSVIATLAVRTGFCRLLLVDDDVVEISNLNRQAFYAEDLGSDKADALRARLEALSPAVEIEHRVTRITAESAEEFVRGVDFVVNTVDFDDVSWALNRAARKAGVPVLFPMNMAWGGFCLAFMPDSPGLESLVGPEPPHSDAEFLGRLFSNLEDFVMPEYLARRLHELPQIVSAAELPAPQTAIAAHRSASLVVEALVRLAAGEPVRSSPRAMYLDAWEAWGA